MLKYALIMILLHSTPGSTDWEDSSLCQRCVEQQPEAPKKKSKKKKKEVDLPDYTEMCREAAEKPNSKKWEKLRETYCRDFAEELENDDK